MTATGYSCNHAKCEPSINPQTTLRGPMDPRQHLDNCKTETEHDPAEILT